MFESVLAYRGYFYCKLSVALIAICVIAYIAYLPFGDPHGDTWLGYTLGGMSAALVLWLAWYGVRKRRYGVGKLNLEDWLSAHIYLGLSLLIIATLHTGFEFGLNIHTLTYVLLVLVIASGIYGIFIYYRMPTRMTETVQATSIKEMINQIAEINLDCRQTASVLEDDVNGLIRNAVEKTQIGGGVWQQLSMRYSNCPTDKALAEVRKIAERYTGEEADAGRKLVRLLARKIELLARARRYVQQKAILNIWLYFHIPLTFALMAALITHVISVFYYW